LTVVAIIAVLAAVAVPSIITIQRNLRFARVEEAARTIFLAAQSRMSELAASGELDALVDETKTPVVVDEKAGTRMDEKPKDFPEFLSWNADNYYYLDSHKVVEETGRPETELLVTAESIGELASGAAYELNITDGGQFYIEYNIQSGMVYGVFFSNSTFTYPPSNGELDADFRTDSSLRKGADPMFGYYGGANIDLSKVPSLKAPEFWIVDDDGDEEWELNPVAEYDHTLYVRFSKLIKDGISYSYNLRLTDQHENMVEIIIPSGDVPAIYNDFVRVTTGNTVVDLSSEYYTVTLDRLVGDGFNKIFSTLTPGDDLTITLTVQATQSVEDGEDISLLPSSTTQVYNSLFASRSEGNDLEGEVDGDTVNIANARHLQNLDESHSGVNKAAVDNTTGLVVAAKQTADIAWPEDIADDTETQEINESVTYQFKPIGNDPLLSYNGQGNKITGLDAPMFGVFGGDEDESKTLEDINLVNSKVAVTAANTNAGALAQILQYVNVEKCAAYSDGEAPKQPEPPEGEDQTTPPPDADYKNATVSGTGSVGGLVGLAQNCTISESFAAMNIITGSTSGSVGGLVGLAEGTSFSKCWADTGYWDMTGTEGKPNAWHETDEIIDVGLIANGGNVSGFACFGGTENEAENCYSVGNISGNIGSGNAAGFAYVYGGAEVEFRNCYAAVTYKDADVTSGTIFGFANAGTSFTNCNYLNTSGITYKEPEGVTEPKGVSSKKLAECMDGKSGWVSGKRNTEASTKVYGRVDVDETDDDKSAITYPYPRLSNTIHYGDWADAAEARLVYYELYDTNKDGAGDVLGKWTGNVSGNGTDEYGVWTDDESVDADELRTLNSTSVLPDDTGVVRGVAVVEDGYGFIVPEGDAFDSDGVVSVSESGTESEVEITNDKPVRVSVDGVNYDLYKMNLADIYTSRASLFYTQILYTPTGSEAQDDEKLWLNPNFAKTNTVAESIPKSRIPGGDLSADPIRPIYIRTARQLSRLGLLGGTAPTSEGGSLISGGAAWGAVPNNYWYRGYQQDRDIDFETYGYEAGKENWKLPLYRIGYNGNAYFDQYGGNGDKTGTNFFGTYNGGCFIIEGADVSPQDQDNVVNLTGDDLFSESASMGLFGTVVCNPNNVQEDLSKPSNGANLKDIVFLSDLEGVNTYSISGSSQIGGLVGYTFCARITNCAVAGFNITATGPVRDDGVGVQTGGFVGHCDNYTLITNCSAANITVDGVDGTGGSFKSTYTGENFNNENNTYKGGFVGTNNGAIENSYAFVSVGQGNNDIAADVPGAQTVDESLLGTMYSFAGTTFEHNIDSYIENCYSVALNPDGTLRREGFTYGVTGDQEKNTVRWETGREFGYVNGLTGKEAYNLGEIDSIALKSLADVNTGCTLGWNDNKSVISEPISESLKGKAFPFPGAVRNKAGDYIHYGNWPAELVPEKPEPTLVYYEKYEDDSYGVWTNYAVSASGVNMGELDSLNSRSILADGLAVVEDGYGFIVPLNGSFDGGVGGASISQGGAAVVEFADGNTTVVDRVIKESVKYNLYKLDLEEIETRSASVFYTPITYTPEGGTAQQLWLNPNFAKTNFLDPRTTGSRPAAIPGNDVSVTPTNPIIIRTARQLSRLGLMGGAMVAGGEWGAYRDESNGEGDYIYTGALNLNNYWNRGYQQERDIDFEAYESEQTLYRIGYNGGAYDWYRPFTNPNNDDDPLNNVRVEGNRMPTNFYGSYNGGCFIIEGASVMTQDVLSTLPVLMPDNNLQGWTVNEEASVGLFGAVAGRITEQDGAPPEDGGGKLTNIVFLSDLGGEDDPSGTNTYSISGSDQVGGLVGYAYGAEITNCATAGFAIIAEGPEGRADDVGVQTGGFIGHCDNYTVISKCSAANISVTDEEGVTTGGYFESKAELPDSYKGGFVGTNNGAIENSYALTTAHPDRDTQDEAGFGTLYSFAGATYEENDDSYIENCYSVALDVEGNLRTVGFSYGIIIEVRDGVEYRLDRNTTYWDTGIDYYKNQNENNYSEILGLVSSDGSELGWNSNGAIIAHPFSKSLEGRAFPFPGAVTNAEGQYVHYGNWATSIAKQPTLVYYEKYEDGTYGLWADDAARGYPGLDTLNSRSVLEGGLAVVEDGYGFIVTDGGDFNESGVVSGVSDLGIGIWNAEEGIEITNVIAGNIIYDLYKLEPTDIETMNASTFYTPITYTPEGGPAQPFWLNPSFAKTNVAAATAPTQIPGENVDADLTDDVTGIKNPIIIRTARQLSMLGQLGGTAPKVVEDGSVGSWISGDPGAWGAYLDNGNLNLNNYWNRGYQQERDIDFEKYTAFPEPVEDESDDGEADEGESGEDVSGEDEDKVPSQRLFRIGYNGGQYDYSTTPGNRAGTVFFGSYNGGEYIIEGAKVETQDDMPYSEEDDFFADASMGLFGAVASRVSPEPWGRDEPSDGGNLTDIVFLSDLGGTYIDGTEDTIDTYSISGSNQIGGLVGYAYGATITNCATAGFAIIAEGPGYNSDNGVQTGGFIGNCDSYTVITNCSAANISVTDDEGNITGGSFTSTTPGNINNTYKGGFVGANNGVIRNSYAFVTVDPDSVVPDDPDTADVDERFETVYSFAGSTYMPEVRPDRESDIINCYSVALNPDGTLHAAGFTYGVTGTNAGYNPSYWRTGVEYNGWNDTAINGLAGMGRNFGDLVYAYPFSASLKSNGELLSTGFPFPGAVTRGGQYVHYGNWAKPEVDPPPAPKLVYWEQYEDGYGVWDGSDINTLRDATVIADGYGFLATQGGAFAGDVSGAIDVTYEAEVSTGNYLYTLNLAAIETNTAAVFYTQITYTPTEGDETEYWLNPSFAKTNLAVEPTTNPDTGERLVPGRDAQHSIIIRSARQLANLGYGQLESSTTNLGYYSRYYLQEIDIDFDEYDSELPDMTPIGYRGWSDDQSARPFTGYYDGGENSISGISISSDQANIGLFGYVGSGTISNCRVTELSIISSGGGRTVGGFVGINNGGTIEYCNVTVTVTIINGGGDTIGGFVGTHSGTITGCYAAVTINKQGGGTVGGFVGVITSGTISNCTVTELIINPANSGGTINDFVGGRDGGEIIPPP
jgi:hypothetical protein